MVGLEAQNLRLSTNFERMVDEQRRASPVRNADGASVNLGSTFERDVDQNFFGAAAKDAIKVEGVTKPEAGSEDEEPAEDVQSDEDEVILTDGQKYCLEAHCYMHAHGVGQSIENALHYYNASIQMGEPKAMLAMAEYNETGFNMRVNHAKAEEYLRQAADAGEPEA